MLNSHLAQSHKTPLSPPKKFGIGIVLDFSWDIFMSQEKLQTMIMQNFGGVKEVYYGARREWTKSHIKNTKQLINLEHSIFTGTSLTSSRKDLTIS